MLIKLLLLVVALSCGLADGQGWEELGLELRSNVHRRGHNQQQCTYQLVESMPEKLTFEQELPFEIAKTHEVFLKLIKSATKSLRIATFELTLLRQSTKIEAHHDSMKPGYKVLAALAEAARNRNVTVEIIYGLEGATSKHELNKLTSAGVILKHLDVTKLTGRGVQHAKMLIADEEHFYLGSANWDWQSLTQVKELGIFYENCPLLASDLAKVHQTWSLVADLGYIPESMPENLLTRFNSTNPMMLNMDNVKTDVYLATSPRIFDGNNNKRTEDLTAILDTINRAEKFVHISVMNYNPVLYATRTYHPEIEHALKRASFERNVEVKLLFSVGAKKKLRPYDLRVYQSLDILRTNNPRVPGIAVKLYSVPVADEFQDRLTFARIKHDKYIITDNSAYIGTSNWTPDYFENTCGVGISIRPSTTREGERNVLTNLEAIFERDYNSSYAIYAMDYKI